MAASKRDGFYKRGRFWWTRHPGTKARVSTGCTDLEAARRWRDREARAAANPAHAAAAEARLGDWIARWLDMKARGSSEATMNVARTKLGHWVRIIGANALLADLDSNTFDRFVAARRTEHVTDHTISKEVSHMLAVLKRAKRARCYPGDLGTLRPPELHAGYEPRKRAMTRPELAALLSELEPKRGAFVAVCVALGCRRSEALRLLPTDVGADRVLVRGTKTRGARREVPLLSLYRPLLALALPYLPLERWGNAGRDLAAASKRAGIARVTPNDFRRTHSTLLIEAGVDRDVVRRLLGHSTTAMVDRVYGQPTPEALGALVEERLQFASPLLAVQVRHTGEVEGEETHEKPAQAPVAQGIEQRFPKPVQDATADAGNAGSLGEEAPRTSANVGENPRASLGAGTSTSHSALPRALASALTAGPAPHVVSLAEAYRAAMRQDGPGARAALAKCAAELLGEARHAS